MQFRTPLLLALTSFLLSCGSSSRKESPTKIELSSDTQVFVDDFLIERMERISRTLHSPQKARENPVLKADRPWEGDLPLEGGTVLFDEEEQLFKMWYNSLPNKDRPQIDEYLCYAISHDGISWEKPDLGLVEFRGSRANNILLKWSNWYHCVLRDEADPDPRRRYKLAYWQTKNRNKCGIWIAFSPDGIRWNKYPDNPVVPCSATGDTFTTMQDPGSGNFFLYHKSKIRPIRKVSRLVSSDFIHWRNDQLVLEPDELDAPDTEFYSLAAFPYAGQYLGFLRVFHTYSQLMDVQLVSSRDGLDWNRSGRRRVFLPLGFMKNEYGGSSFDSGMNSAITPVEKDNKLWIYYPGFDNLHNAPASEHRGEIGLAQLRVDGFCSLDATSKGYVLTRPLTFEGSTMVVNAAIHSFPSEDGLTNTTWSDLFTHVPGGKGALTVEVQDVRGQPIPGYEASNCEPVYGDGVKLQVRWKGDSDLSKIQGRTVKLKFILKNTSLYSFRIGNS